MEQLLHITPHALTEKPQPSRVWKKISCDPTINSTSIIKSLLFNKLLEVV